MSASPSAPPAVRPEAPAADGGGSDPLPASRREPGESRMTLPTAGGRTVRLRRETDSDLLHVEAPDGRVEMEIRFTDDGPVLRFPSAGLRMETDQDVELACRDFRVRARGEVELEAGETARVEGYGVRVESRRADVRIRANDNVRVDGERILLNC